jgi:hypothetical protein
MMYAQVKLVFSALEAFRPKNVCNASLDKLNKYRSKRHESVNYIYMEVNSLMVEREREREDMVEGSPGIH